MAYKNSLFLETYRRFIWTQFQGMWRSKSLHGFSSHTRGLNSSGLLYILDRNCHQCCLRCALTPSLHGCWTHYWWFGMGHLFLILFLFLLLLTSHLLLFGFYFFGINGESFFSSVNYHLPLWCMGCLQSVVKFERKPELASVNWPFLGRGQGFRVLMILVYCRGRGGSRIREKVGRKLEWQALWLLGSTIKHQALGWIGICNASKWSRALAQL